MSEVSVHVDEPLRSTRVAVIGAGGLGTPALLALLHAGARRLYVVEPDRVERTNLHRQLFYRDADVGRRKLDVLRARITARWPDVELELEVRPFGSGPLHAALPEGVGLVLDGTDDLGTKLALADACVAARVPFVFAGVVGWDGQVLGVLPERSPCPRCLFEAPPPPGAAPTCEQVGVLGPVAGVVAARQVAVARSLLGTTPEVGALWVYDGRAGRARAVRLGRDPECRGCGAGRPRAAAPETSPARAHGEGARPAGVDASTDAELDLTGLACPETFRRTRRRLEALEPGATLRVVLSSDESSRVVPASLAAAGHHVRARGVVDGRHVLIVERAADAEAPMDEGVARAGAARHARQHVLVGDQGQARLAAASAVVDGEGLAAEVAALYLAGAGVGRVDVASSLVAAVQAQDPGVIVTRARARADARLALHVAAGEARAPGREAVDRVIEAPLGDEAADPVGLGAELARRALLTILGLGDTP